MNAEKLAKRSAVWSLFLATAAALLVFTVFTPQVYGQSFGFNRIRVAASTMDTFGPTAPMTILSTSIRTGSSADLILSLTSECAIAFTEPSFLTSNGFTGSDTSSLTADVEVWVEVDGHPVPVNSSALVPDNGRIAFCKLERMADGALVSSFSTTLTTDQFNRGRTSNAFNWVAKGVGYGNHTVAVKAAISQSASGSFSTFTSTVTNPPTVEGIVGKRLLIVELVSGDE